MGSIEPAIFDVLDIRGDKMQQSLKDLVLKSLCPKDGSKPSLPTLLLYDEKGLRLFEDITYLDEYYLTNAEIETLLKNAEHIAACIPAGSRLIELGSGNLRKVDILLQAFEKAQKAVDYYALDLSLEELHRTFAEIGPDRYHYVSLHALHGTYDDGLSWLANNQNPSQSTCIMTLGSSVGNFTRTEAAQFLKAYAQHLRPSDWILVGLDACQDEKRVLVAYNDAAGVTEQFYRNGLENANKVLGYEAFKQDEWKVKRTYDNIDHKHQASYVALVDTKAPDFHLPKGQEVQLEYACKYAEDQRNTLWHESGLVPQWMFANNDGDYHLHLLSPAVIDFSNEPRDYASQPVPTLPDWENLWSAWDIVTKAMIPRDELLNKPIKLRNDLIFYLGHIPTFADIHFVKATGAKPTDPSYYTSIFERGIDPDVDNPELCHDHSELPDTWPPLPEVMGYSSRVRTRIVESIQSGRAVQDRKLSRGLWLAYEHEAMHLETFLYMLLQSSRVLPPPGVETPDFANLAKQAQENREPNAWHEIPASDVRLGLDDAEDNLPPNRYFGWDNERPARMIKAPKFAVQSRGISNGEYAKFLEDTSYDVLPASWTTTSTLASGSSDDQSLNGAIDFSPLESRGIASHRFVEDKAIRTVFGPVPLKLALDWPIMASYDELAAYARWADARIPTLEEARSIYAYVEAQKKLSAESVPSSLISAVNGHLCNDGVEETPPLKSSTFAGANGETAASPDPEDFFIDLTGCDVAYKTWHPTAITGNGNRLRGQSETGGLWEWTSSPLASFEGFKCMDLYPGYTADFFDEKHNIVLGGSWATVPRIAGRKSFINWYQRNYPYTWATARLVRDLE